MRNVILLAENNLEFREVWGRILSNEGYEVKFASNVQEALGFLFFTRMDHANVRMDSYHTELVQTYWLELLLAVSEQLPAEKQILSKEQIINAAIESWFTKRADTSKTPVIAPQTMKSREG